MTLSILTYHSRLAGDTTPPSADAIRGAGGLLEFSSVASAEAYLRATYLPCQRSQYQNDADWRRWNDWRSRTVFLVVNSAAVRPLNGSIPSNPDARFEAATLIGRN